jgi:pimeloyl-ACP methyl ester carboxylesterase
MRRLPFQWFTSVVLAAFVMCVVPAHAQLPIQSSDFFLTTPDSVSIHVHRKVIGSVGGGFAGASVLLVHGTFGDARTWDFPGRSVMDRLAAEGYDVYALDLRGMGSSDKPANYFTIDIVNRVTDAATVAGYILATTHHAPVVLGWSQGGVITGLLAANAPQLVAGVGFLVGPRGRFFRADGSIAGAVPNHTERSGSLSPNRSRDQRDNLWSFDVFSGGRHFLFDFGSG